MRRNLSTSVVWQFCVGTLTVLLFGLRSVQADLVIDLPDITVFSDNVNSVMGELEIFLTLTGSDLTTPPEISSFNLCFLTNGTGLSFDAALAATTTPLFTTGPFTDNSTSTNIIAAHDVLPSSETAFNNAGLAKVQFTVAPGNVGTTYILTWEPTGVEIADPTSTAYSVTLLPGSITVSAVPEATAWLCLLLVTLVSILAKRLSLVAKHRLSLAK